MEDQLPTLEEVFRAVPKRVAFDVEIKMTEGDDVERTPPEEVERVVNCIWDVVRQHGRHGPEAAPAAEAAASTAAAAAGRSEVPEDHASASGAPARRDLFFSSFDPGECESGQGTDSTGCELMGKGGGLVSGGAEPCGSCL